MITVNNMSDWDRKYHLQKTPKLKVMLITCAIVISLIVGLIIAERIAYSMTFPPSSTTEEIDGNIFYIETEGYHNIEKICLKTDTNGNDIFPVGINATIVWFIPIRGRFWAWRDYFECPLVYSNFSSPSCSLYAIDDLEPPGSANVYSHYVFNILVEVSASENRLFYLHIEGINLLEL